MEEEQARAREDVRKKSALAPQHARLCPRLLMRRAAARCRRLFGVPQSVLDGALLWALRSRSACQRGRTGDHVGHGR